MSTTAIKVEEIGKLYRLGEIGTGTISHDLNRWIARMRGKADPYATIGETNDRTSKGNSEYVWALKDISFEVKQGEVLGIIGRNGAGKSTLLKILSKVTTPTTGCIKVNGRIASLLEVGTGFHPELTGRENIFLNGAILGMTKAEIRRKFDEIVDFSGVERYIDTPVKRYSSGMYVRLAFAVAAFLEPEILIIDEVLAVGDAEFQKKCLGRMKDVSENDGRTVLFVSHNMGAIQQLCNSTVILEYGRLVSAGETQRVVSEYLRNKSNLDSSFAGPGESSKKAWFKKIYLTDGKGNSNEEYLHDEPILINYEIGYNVPKDEHDYSVFCIILDEVKNRVCATESSVIRSNKVTLKIDPEFLVRGTYSLYTFIHKARTEQVDSLEDVCQFTVIDNGSPLNIHGNYDYGRVFGKGTWAYTN
jgi:lipopolysaccharide transport system ATP-binding protein